MNTRRHFLGAAAGLLAAGAASRHALAAAPDPSSRDSAATAAPLHPHAGRPYNPVVTLNGWSLPFRMRDGVKEFHLVAEPVVREIAPGMTAKLWGYNGMLIGVFQLVSSAAAQAQTVREVIAAERDYWLAEADWQAAQWGVEPPAGSWADTSAAATSSPSSPGGH